MGRNRVIQELQAFEIGVVLRDVHNMGECLDLKFGVGVHACMFMSASPTSMSLVRGEHVAATASPTARQEGCRRMLALGFGESQHRVPCILQVETSCRSWIMDHQVIRSSGHGSCRWKQIAILCVAIRISTPPINATSTITVL